MDRSIKVKILVKTLEDPKSLKEKRVFISILEHWNNVQKNKNKDKL